MKNTTLKMTAVLACILLQLFLTQSAIGASLPVVENYDKGELDLMVSPFGMEAPIKVGKVLADGTIHFSWPAVDLSKVENADLYLEPIVRAVGMNFCNDKDIKQNNETVKVVDTKTISLYKYGQLVGNLYPATQQDLQDNAGSNRSSSLVLGSSISWFYSEDNAVFEAKCTVNVESENSYSFKEVTNYSLQLKKGWNIVQYTLLEKEDWKNEESHGSLPKTAIKESLTEIPNTINWTMKYWANDELLEIEHKLITQTPVTQQTYNDWLPKELGDLKRTHYEVGKKLATMPNSNNINVIFGGKEKTIDLTIADGAGSKDAASVFTMMLDMTSTEWKDESETGYESSTKMNGVPVLVKFDSNTKSTTMSYNASNRFIIKASAKNIEPKTLWQYLKGLQLDQLN